MTQEQRLSKNFFKLNGGLNTEANEIGFPDGFTTDEANYELLQDGSRRRRKGLAAESGAGSVHTVDTLGSGYCNQTYLWSNVGGNPDLRLMVFRTGDFLYFATADETISDGWYSSTGKFIQLDPFRTSGATDALVQKEPLTFSQGRGYLFVSGPYIKPFYIEYVPGTATFTASRITVVIRDYTTIDDGTPVTKEPTGTITDDHRYNLRNRGWNEVDMAQFLSDKSKHPSRAAIWFKGYKRTYGTSVAEADGTRSWDSTKMDSEVWGASSAPVGSMFLNVHDTTTGLQEGSSNAGTLEVETWSYTPSGADWIVKLDLSGQHDLALNDTVTLSGLTFDFTARVGGVDYYVYDYDEWNGEITVTDPDPNGDGATSDDIEFTVEAPLLFQSFISQYKTLGQVDTDPSLTRSSGTAHGDSPRAIEFHAGRVFYGGMLNQEFNDYIFFSQLAIDTERFEKCYQEADPTDENFNALVATDGGYMVIAGMGGVHNLVSLRGSLIVLASNGIWEISGGRQGIFTPDGYIVRQITNEGCIGPSAYSVVDDSLVYAGSGGIYVISPNQYTGILEATSLTETSIQTLWNQIPQAEQERMQAAYDSSQKRLYFMYGPNGTSFAIDTMLIFDVKLGAWYKYTFDTPTDNVLLTGFAIANADDSSDNKRMKFIYEVSTTTVQVADFDQTSFDDWDGTNGPLPYMYTGWDNLGDFQKRRQAPVVTVFNQRTETGYTSSGNGYAPVNDSSTLMSAYWDWTSDATNEATTNKIGATQEVYRHPRIFVPSGASDLDGYPVVVSRNKVRGRGRVLQLKFEGAADKDSHILGFSVNYKVSRRV